METHPRDVGGATPPTDATTPPRADAADEGEYRAPLERVLRSVLAIAGARAAVLRLLDESGAALDLVAAVGAPAGFNLRATHVSPDCGVCGEALHQDSTRCATAACACAREFAQVHGEGEERVFALPLHHRGVTCGVLTLFLAAPCEAPQALSDLLPAIGDLLALALENARLAHDRLHHSLLQERELLAGEIHDTLAQNLTCMRMRAALLRNAITRHDEARALGYLADVDESLRVAHGRVRELITDYRTRMDPNGLVHALSGTVAELDGLNGVRLDFDNLVDCLDLSAEQELQVFHIVREALANIVKHAQARHGRLTLEHNRDSYCVTVQDDGVGLPGTQGHDADHGHFGMNIMRERARRIGGHIEFGSDAGEGTWMRLCFPGTNFNSEVAR